MSKRTLSVDGVQIDADSLPADVIAALDAAATVDPSTPNGVVTDDGTHVAAFLDPQLAWFLALSRGRTTNNVPVSVTATLHHWTVQLGVTDPIRARFAEPTEAEQFVAQQPEHVRMVALTIDPDAREVCATCEATPVWNDDRTMACCDTEGIHRRWRLFGRAQRQVGPIIVAETLDGAMSAHVFRGARPDLTYAVADDHAVELDLPTNVRSYRLFTDDGQEFGTVAAASTEVAWGKARAAARNARNILSALVRDDGVSLAPPSGRPELRHIGHANGAQWCDAPAGLTLTEAIRWLTDVADHDGVTLDAVVAPDGTLVPMKAEVTITLDEDDGFGPLEERPVTPLLRKSAIKAVKLLTKFGHQQAANIVDGHDNLLPPGLDGLVVRGQVGWVLDSYKMGRATFTAVQALLEALDIKWSPGTAASFTYANEHGKWDVDGHDWSLAMLRLADGSNQAVETGLPEDCPDPLRVAKRLASLAVPEQR